MSELQNRDIGDDEIRIISSETSGKIDKPSGEKSDSIHNFGNHGNYDKKYRWLIIIGCVVVVMLAICMIAFAYIYDSNDVETSESTESESVVTPVAKNIDKEPTDSKGFVEINDTVVNGKSLTILTPTNGTPILGVGEDSLDTPGVFLAMPAADIREDNGEIVGAFVLKGELLSKGRSKAGFCAIIGDKPVIGVSDATPYLEQALDNEGYFFRQYPLVVGGQIVENKPKGRSLRKALIERDGKISVVLSNDRMTFHDFSQSLVDLGVSNAIYLVGSSAYGFALDQSGTHHAYGIRSAVASPNDTYLIWQ